ncbi:uncharacterized protein LOC128669661 isoform X2 [Plodia interpunctella]|uniref:uncharacterized protein LOC128669661 isoform X2 n=1 Tax=Plodia interpunctella TaxID=58824 RepID=UPI00236794CF|nr:uncharacterized protein LOC128669661 isoform X2 [Plodia interpunctella]
MDILITLFYLLFSICVIYPPTEFVAAGFTIAQLFENYLGSENVNFIGYHMKRITITALIHTMLPLGYVFALWCGGERGPWMLSAAAATAIIPLLMCYELLCWWEYDRRKHPAVKALLCYTQPGQDWRITAADINIEFRSVDKVSIALTATSKFVATENWLIKVSQYSVNIVKQGDCALVATATDSHNLTPTGEDEIQYINIEVIPSRDDVKRFTFRISTAALRDLQPRLVNPVRVPEHISLLPTLIERFVNVFKQHIEQNPVYYVDQELELCIGCMQSTADVKISRRCLPPPQHLQGGPPQCQQCNCSKSVNNETWLISTLEHVIQKKMADENHLKMLDKHLDELGMALPDALIKYSPECQDIVTSCRWQNHMLPCRRLFRKQFTDWGLCCVLDPVRLQKKHTRRLFDHLETTRRLDIGLTCRNASTDIHGCELLTVYNGDVNIVPQVLQQGSSYWFRMTFTVTLDNGGSLLDMNRGCESENRYSKLVCMAKCLKQTCGCSDPLKTVSGEEEQLPYCRISQLNCLRSTKTFENSSCLCLPSCSKISVDTSMETNNILMDYNFDPLYGLNSSISNVVYIEVRLQESKVFFLLPTETWLTLLSSFGGVFNMFLGVGLFSALEFLFLIIKLLLALRKSAEIHIPETHYH